MDLDETESYVHAIEILEAQEMLKGITVTTYPNMKRQAQEKLHRALHKKGFPDTYAKTVTPDQLAQMLKAGKL